MLNQCIVRKKSHYDQSSRPVSANVSSSSLVTRKDSTGIAAKHDEEAGKESMWDAEEAEVSSESDDEFFEAMEEPGNSAAVEENGEDVSGCSVSKDKVERCGVLVESGMRLLETGEALCIPITQVISISISHIIRR